MGIITIGAVNLDCIWFHLGNENITQKKKKQTFECNSNSGKERDLNTRQEKKHREELYVIYFGPCI